eukprot:GHVS01051127.1.p1 GENE.GHVS01051127.1~~GHVS01051127.1.p1  ORF type:complete len:254 (-),score=-5.52 GHVS01051127.1:376-1137(-)
MLSEYFTVSVGERCVKIRVIVIPASELPLLLGLSACTVLGVSINCMTNPPTISVPLYVQGVHGVSGSGPDLCEVETNTVLIVETESQAYQKAIEKLQAQLDSSLTPLGCREVCQRKEVRWGCRPQIGLLEPLIYQVEQEAFEALKTALCEAVNLSRLPDDVAESEGVEIDGILPPEPGRNSSCSTFGGFLRRRRTCTSEYPVFQEVVAVSGTVSNGFSGYCGSKNWSSSKSSVGNGYSPRPPDALDTFVWSSG